MQKCVNQDLMTDPTLTKDPRASTSSRPTRPMAKKCRSCSRSSKSFTAPSGLLLLCKSHRFLPILSNLLTDYQRHQDPRAKEGLVPPPKSQWSASRTILIIIPSLSNGSPQGKFQLSLTTTNHPHFPSSSLVPSSSTFKQPMTPTMNLASRILWSGAKLCNGYSSGMEVHPHI